MIEPGAEPKRRRKKAKVAQIESGPPQTFSLTDPHVLSGLAYAQGVVAGKISACKWVRLACQRQLDDLERSKADPSWPYEFDEGLAGRACRFAEQLPHIQGPLAGQLFKAEPWQLFIDTTVYGWVRRGTQEPRFRRAYEEEPRGQGKSFRLSAKTLYAFAQGAEGAEIVSAATTREQASKVWEIAEAMLRKRPAVRDRLGLEANSFSIFQRTTNSTFKPLSREAKKTGDGKNIYFASVDELHAHPTRETWDVLDTGTGKRPDSRIWIITTAGFDTAGICYEKRLYSQKVLERTITDESWFAIIYTVDDADDWSDAECREACADHSHPGCVWRKANPNWGVSVEPQDFSQKAMRAIQVASEQNSFLAKHLCIWSSAARPWIPLKEWDRCANVDLAREDFAGTPCFIGLDLASKSDVTAKALMFSREEPHRDAEQAADGKTERHVYLFLDSYLPEAAVSDSHNSQYDGWVREGRIVTTSGVVTDYGVIRDAILLDHVRFAPREVPFDPYNATHLVADLMREGVPMIEYGVNVKNFSPAMKEFEALVLTRRLHHDGNPVLRWMLSNVNCKEDSKGNVFPRKQRPEHKIDGVMAALSALGRAMLGGESPDSVYESRGLRSL